MANNLETSKNIIENFSDESSFTPLNNKKYLNIDGAITNKVYAKEDPSNIDLKINFIKSENSKIFLGKNLKGSATITVRGNNSYIYIGNDCNFKKLIIDSNQKSDFIAIGNHVTTNFGCAFRSGLRATQHENNHHTHSAGIIIGDDCMFASDCLVRSSDAHPILEYPSLKHLNEPIKSVVIEEHVWIAANATVLKNITIGANSVIAFGSVITKDLPKYSLAKGNPMSISNFKGRLWQREFTEQSELMALKFYKKYDENLEKKQELGKTIVEKQQSSKSKVDK